LEKNMKTQRTRLFTCAIALILVLSSFATVSMAAEAKSDINKKELKVLIASAKTPAEHARIAAYYHQQANHLAASAKEHAAMADVYAKNPTFAALESKLGFAFGQGASHCRHWAQLEDEQAKQAEALAAEHDEMAKAAEQK
jgi:hypothetical protein